MPGPGISAHLALKVSHWFWQGVDWIFPPACIICGKQGERWCTDCQSLVVRVGKQVCSRCGKRIKRKTFCSECMEREPAFTALRSFGLYCDPLRQAILKVKYYRDLGLGEILAGFIARLVEEQDWNPELVIPVPLSQERMLERGYNQVDLFARPMAWSLGLPYHSHILKRVQDDKSQVRLTARGRRTNVSNAFQVEEAWRLRGKCVLLVDDVATTGSTADACASVLLGGGASEVFVATLARSQLRKSKDLAI